MLSHQPGPLEYLKAITKNPDILAHQRLKQLLGEPAGEPVAITDTSWSVRLYV